MNKEAKVYMLPTNGLSSITKGKGEYSHLYHYNPKDEYVEDEDEYPIHLYIISDKVVKKGDYYIHKELDSKLDSVKQLLEDGEFLAKKIIATTDPKLRERSIITETDKSIIHSVMPRIPQSFIEEYCKAGGIEYVDVEYEDANYGALFTYKDGSTETIIAQKLKVYPIHNTITTHRIVEKMYSREELTSFAKYAIKNGFGLNHTESLFDKWVEENL